MPTVSPETSMWSNFKDRSRTITTEARFMMARRRWRTAQNPYLFTNFASDMKIDDINKGLICKYCGKRTELVDSAEIYNGVSYGKIYLCRNCHAYVSCHRGTDRAMGFVANSELRKLRHQAHGWFDAIWKNKIKKSRYNAYSWLSLRLGLNKDITHMGMFNEEECEKVIHLCSEYIKEKNIELWTALNNELNV